ncbi:hypothetical protein BDY21DRAFT_339162 [Lineolata rhizophorae]|uniref:Uncharacterized protein n=1 Tax=Lineolata rhizophorae TaxID=578093 RepID=A0A6A6P4C7_9PEZI|nr:hypothetical protein BDY21DRAFT_339162 [Lineolata rhizophorae]
MTIISISCLSCFFLSNFHVKFCSPVFCSARPLIQPTAAPLASTHPFYTFRPSQRKISHGPPSDWRWNCSILPHFIPVCLRQYSTSYILHSWSIFIRRHGPIHDLSDALLITYCHVPLYLLISPFSTAFFSLLVRHSRFARPSPSEFQAACSTCLA